MKTLKIWLMSLALTMGFAATAKAELSDILSSGTVKIAIPENFPPFGALGIEGRVGLVGLGHSIPGNRQS